MYIYFQRACYKRHTLTHVDTGTTGATSATCTVAPVTPVVAHSTIGTAVTIRK